MSRLICVALILSASCAAAQEKSAPDAWVSLFNGKDLAGWIPKFAGRPLGENYKDTFRVEDGVIKVSYDKYEKFEGKFGHLFYKEPFSHYRLRVEYRFTGSQCPGGPDWAFRNSGAMLHCQAPETIRQDQDFPVCVEVQFLGGRGTGERHTANLCTPGTNVVMDGKLVTRHCIDSTSKTYHGDGWVTVEVEVRGHSFKHFIDGQVVLAYTEAQLDQNDADGKRLIKEGKKLVESGYISLQAESHPCEFRKVEILRLKE
jgi:hypothetical protein